MPASVVPISGRRQGTFVVLEAAFPGWPLCSIGVLLTDLEAGHGWLRFRDHFEDLADPDDVQVLSGIESHLRQVLAGDGPTACLAWLTDSLSNNLRVTEPQTIAVDAFSRVLEQLYHEQVEPVRVGPETHVPLHTLRAAAGGLGDETLPEPEDHIPLPPDVRPSPDLFCAHVVGHSMEPRIPDGSLNLFRLHPVGSRQGKILLIQRFGSIDESARFTLKRYTSIKKHDEVEERWVHERVRLEPLNPEFDAWDLEPDAFAVVAEWLRVIE